MSAAHTTGPWVIHTHRQIGPSNGVVCEVWSAVGVGSDDAISQADANARLIAAAPELLEALQVLTSDALGSMTGSEVSAAYDSARAAIAKATGGAA